LGSPAAALRQIFLAFAAIPVVFAGVAQANVDGGMMPDGGQVPDVPAVQSLYGDRIEFGIYRNGSAVGQHLVQFDVQGDALRVQTSVQIEVGALFLTLFEFDYQSDALWQDGRLVALDARTNQNGDIAVVQAQAEAGSLKVRGPEGASSTEIGIYPTNHWNAGVIGVDKILNTITGRVSDVQLVPLGVEKVETAHGVIDATRYKYEGAIENEVWYDASGRWVGMQFLGGDGSTIELRCRKCQPTETASAGF